MQKKNKQKKQDGNNSVQAEWARLRTLNIICKYIFLSCLGNTEQTAKTLESGSNMWKPEPRLVWWQRELKMGHFKGFGDKKISGHNTKMGSGTYLSKLIGSVSQKWCNSIGILWHVTFMLWCWIQSIFRFQTFYTHGFIYTFYFTLKQRKHFKSTQT